MYVLPVEIMGVRKDIPSPSLDPLVIFRGPNLLEKHEIILP